MRPYSPVMNRNEMFRHRLANLAQTVLLVVGLGALAGGLAYSIGGGFLAWIVLVGAGVVWFSAPAFSTGVVLRMARARPIASWEAPELHGMLAEIARRARLPRVPGLYLTPGPVANAFSTGEPGDAAVAVSEGLVARLDEEEMAGVLAHEVSHIRHRDTRVMRLAELAGRVTGTLSFFGQVLLFLMFPLYLAGMAPFPFLTILLLLFSPTIAAFARLALSRTREYRADLGAVELLGRPGPLVRALRKMQAPERNLFRMLFPGYRPRGLELLLTHPPTEERIRRLESLGGGSDRLASVHAF